MSEAGAGQVREADAEEVLRLGDGRSVLLRTCAGADEAAVDAFLQGLTREELDRFRRIDAPDAAALAGGGPDGCSIVAVAGTDQERVVGLARYRAAAGDMAVAIEGSFHGIGLGRGLVQRLRRVAAAQGVESLGAVVAPGDQDLLDVLRLSGGEVVGTNELAEKQVQLPSQPDEDATEAEVARFAAASAASLVPMFRPAAIAVVGASRRPDSPGGAVFRALIAGFPGPVLPINPTTPEIEGHRTYPTLADAPRPIDLAVVAVPAQHVLGVARDAAAAGVRAMVVLSSGFAEVGAEGRAMQDELLHVVRTSGIRMIGPNCLGLASNQPDLRFNATFGPAPPPPGRMAFASQSGGLGISALEFCAERGLGLSAFASLGNKADTSSNDLIAWWNRDPQTRVILLYLEGFGNPRRFARLARLVARRTPIVALKSGRGAAGRRAAGSHTAALAAGDVSTSALFQAAGVVRVDTVEELFEAGQLIAQQPLPAGRRVGVLSNAGGAAILAADACEARQLEVPHFPPDLQERLKSAGPGVAGTTNPVDLGAGATPEVFTAAGRLIMESGEVDSLVVVYTPPQGADIKGIAEATQALTDGRVPVIGCMSGTGRPSAPDDARWPVPWHSFPESAVRALAHAARTGEFQRRPLDPAVPPPGVDAHLARQALESAPPGAWLEPRAVEDMLGAYGIRVARSRLAVSPDDAAAAQAEIGSTVVVKLVSRTITHKSDVGGVIVGCHSPESAAAAYREIAARLADMGQAAAMDGVLVQEQAEEGLDLNVGAVSDAVFGPLVLAGIGGVEAEGWKDQALALAPVGPRTAESLWGQLRGGALIDGRRGAPGANRARLADVVRRVSDLIAEQPMLAELDLNPVRGLGIDGDVIVLDARARRAGA